jgi:hypothetical protein
MIVLALLFLSMLNAKEINFPSKNGSFLVDKYDNTVNNRMLSENCLENTQNKTSYKNYFTGMRNIYQKVLVEGTCFPIHEKCGWKALDSKLPLYILSVGLEGAGHHLWTEILSQPVFDCVWINGRHYNRDIADGVPKTTFDEQKEAILSQFKMRKDSGKQACKTIYDAEDSFPTGAIRKNSRLFMRPDLINIQMLDGVLFNVKYLIIIRNTTVIIHLYFVYFLKKRIVNQN